MSGIEDDAGNVLPFDEKQKTKEIIQKMQFEKHGGTITKADFIAACSADKSLFHFLLPW